MLPLPLEPTNFPVQGVPHDRQSFKEARQQWREHRGSTEHALNLPPSKFTVLYKYFGQIFGVGNRQEPNVNEEQQVVEMQERSNRQK